MHIRILNLLNGGSGERPPIKKNEMRISKEVECSKISN